METQNSNVSYPDDCLSLPNYHINISHHHTKAITFQRYFSPFILLHSNVQKGHNLLAIEETKRRPYTQLHIVHKVIIIKQRKGF